MAPSVLVNTVESFVLRGTGIRAFSRSLVAALASSGCSIQLLISTHSSSPSSVIVSSNIFQKHQLTPRFLKLFKFLKAKAFAIVIRLPVFVSRRLQAVPLTDPLHALSIDKTIPRLSSHPACMANQSSRQVEHGFLFAPDLFLDATILFKSSRSFLHCKPHRSCRLSAPRDLYHSPLPFPIIVDGVKNICTVHDLIPLSHPDLCLDDPAYFYDLMDGLLESCHGIHCISHYTAGQLLEYYGDKAKGKIFVAHQSIQLTHLTPEYEAKVLSSSSGGAAHDASHSKYILQIGTVEAKKNHQTTLDAFKLLREYHHSLRLVIVGKPGWLTQDLCDYLESPMAREDGVQWLRNSNYKTLVRYIKNASALAFPSLVEGWGLPPLEAMSYGVPAVVSPIAACKEACGDAALYMDDPDDSSSLANQINCLLTQQDLMLDKVQAGFNQAKKYSVEKFAEDLIKGYEQVACAAE